MMVAIVFQYCRSDKNTTVLAHVFYVVVNKEKKYNNGIYNKK